MNLHVTVIINALATLNYRCFQYGV